MGKDQTIILGLSGGIACGKSTTAQKFKDLGVSVLSSDALVAGIYREDDELRESLQERYGAGIILPNAQVDRAAIAARVTQDESELEWLESLLHPRVRKRWQDWLNEEKSIWKLVEIPLLFEKRLEKAFDFTLAVIASRQRQIERLSERGLSEKVSQWWIDRQMPNEQKAAKADFVIFNDGSLEFLHDQIDRLFQEIFQCDQH